MAKAQKLSEKTLELNVCAQLHHAAHSRYRLLWFGLTQRQEAKWGFDACTYLGGRLLIFQFKASNTVLKRSGERRFRLSHQQLDNLRRHVGSRWRSVFYAFPLVGNTDELYKQPDLLKNTWLLDVAGLGAIGAPKTRGGRPKSYHNAYVRPSTATIRSDPVETSLISMHTLAAEGFAGADGMQRASGEADFGVLLETRGLFSAGARGLIIY